MDTTKAKALAIQLMDKYGLLKQGWKFEYDNAKRRFGCCNYTYKVISLSFPLVSLNGEDRVKNTILHEIAHALTPNKGHGIEWKKTAKLIGCDGERCYNSNEVVSAKPNYIAVCPTCSKMHKKFRKPKYNSSCGICSPTFNREHLLVFKRLN